MADVQIEHGYTRVADELLEALSRVDLPGRHLRVMLALVRLTYGYQASSRRVGAGLIGAVCEIDPRHVRRVLGDLEAWGVIVRSPVRAGQTPSVAIVKDFERWSIGATSNAEAKRTRAAGDPGRGQPGSRPPRAAGSPGHAQPGRVDQDPGRTQPGHPGRRQPGHPGRARPASTENSTETSRERGGPPPAAHSALLEILSTQPGTDEEKTRWLGGELPLIAEVARKPGADSIPALVFRYYRAHLKRMAEDAAKAPPRGVPKVWTPDLPEPGVPTIRDLSPEERAALIQEGRAKFEAVRVRTREERAATRSGSVAS